MSQSRLTCPASHSTLRAGATQGILLRSKSHVQVGLSLIGISNPPKLPSASERSEERMVRPPRFERGTFSSGG